MKICATRFPEVLEITPVRHGDERGWFSETWNRETWRAAELHFEWVQENESVSTAVGTVRGIHFQTGAQAQDKLVRVLKGRILDIAVDLRRFSPTLGAHVACELSAKEGNQLLVPRGFGHGFVTLERDCHVAYKVSSLYDRDADAGIHPLDPALAINWGVPAASVILSAKDQAAPTLAEAHELLFDG